MEYGQDNMTAKRKESLQKKEEAGSKGKNGLEKKKCQLPVYHKGSLVSPGVQKEQKERR